MHFHCFGKWLGIVMMKTNPFIGEPLTIISHSLLIIMARHNTIINALKFLYYVCCIAFASLRWDFSCTLCPQDFLWRVHDCLVSYLDDRSYSSTDYQEFLIGDGKYPAITICLEVGFLPTNLQILHYIFLGTLPWGEDDWVQCVKGK